MERLQIAIQLAEMSHRGQFRDGPIALPYITHPFEVMTNLRLIGEVGDESMLSAAILHDTIEETSLTALKIQKAVGKPIAALVVELTREEPTPKQFKVLDAEELYQLRNKMLLDGIERMSSKAMVIKLADRLANVRDSLRTRTGAKLERYLVQTDRILDKIPREINEPLWDAVKAARG